VSEALPEQLTIEVSEAMAEALLLSCGAGRHDYFHLLGLSPRQASAEDVQYALRATERELRKALFDKSLAAEAKAFRENFNRVSATLGDPRSLADYRQEVDAAPRRAEMALLRQFEGEATAELDRLGGIPNRGMLANMRARAKQMGLRAQLADALLNRLEEALPLPRGDDDGAHDSRRRLSVDLAGFAAESHPSLPPSSSANAPISPLSRPGDTDWSPADDTALTPDLAPWQGRSSKQAPPATPDAHPPLSSSSFAFGSPNADLLAGFEGASSRASASMQASIIADEQDDAKPRSVVLPPAPLRQRRHLPTELDESERRAHAEALGIQPDRPARVRPLRSLHVIPRRAFYPTAGLTEAETREMLKAAATPASIFDTSTPFTAPAIPSAPVAPSPFAQILSAGGSPIPAISGDPPPRTIPPLPTPTPAPEDPFAGLFETGLTVSPFSAPPSPATPSPVPPPQPVAPPVLHTTEVESPKKAPRKAEGPLQGTADIPPGAWHPTVAEPHIEGPAQAKAHMEKEGGAPRPFVSPAALQTIKSAQSARHAERAAAKADADEPEPSFIAEYGLLLAVSAVMLAGVVAVILHFTGLPSLGGSGAASSASQQSAQAIPSGPTAAQRLAGLTVTPVPVGSTATPAASVALRPAVGSDPAPGAAATADPLFPAEMAEFGAGLLGPHLLPAFAIRCYEVTNAEYRTFVKSAPYQAPITWPNGDLVPGTETLPVTNVSVQDAKRFLEWRTQAEQLKGFAFTLPDYKHYEALMLPAKQKASRMAAIDRDAPLKAATIGGDAVTPRPSQPAIAHLFGNVSEWAVGPNGTSVLVGMDYTDKVVVPERLLRPADKSLGPNIGFRYVRVPTTP